GFGPGDVELALSVVTACFSTACFSSVANMSVCNSLLPRYLSRQSVYQNCVKTKRRLSRARKYTAAMFKEATIAINKSVVVNTIGLAASAMGLLKHTMKILTSHR